MVAIVRDLVHRHAFPHKIKRIQTFDPGALLELWRAVRIGLCRPETQHFSNEGVFKCRAHLHVLRYVLLHMPFPPADRLQLLLQLEQRVITICLK